VRSGILNSVHTFANDPERGLFILIFLFILVFLSLVIYFLYEKNLKTNNDKFNLLTKESSILINNWFVMYFLSVILIGTIYPIFLEVLSEQKISVGPPFFNKLLIPFLIPFLIFMSIGPNLNWIKNKNFGNKIQLVIFFILNLTLSFFIIKMFGKITLTSTILLAASFYLFFITFKDLIKKNYKNNSQVISHFGFSLLILSILMNSILSKEIITNLKVGEEINFMESTIEFKKIESSSRSNFKSLVGFFEINSKDNKKFLFKPEIRIYNQPKVITSEADIKTNFFKDKFLVINLVKGDNYFNVRYQEKPLMIWIWLSTILIAIGGSVSFLKRYEK
jgi:cytochrome c-type biogenesis protein CcmF